MRWSDTCVVICKFGPLLCELVAIALNAQRVNERRDLVYALRVEAGDDGSDFEVEVGARVG